MASWGFIEDHEPACLRHMEISPRAGRGRLPHPPSRLFYTKWGDGIMADNTGGSGGGRPMKITLAFPRRSHMQTHQTAWHCCAHDTLNPGRQERCRGTQTTRAPLRPALARSAATIPPHWTGMIFVEQGALDPAAPIAVSIDPHWPPCEPGAPTLPASVGSVI
jgi:hypothetical protein